MAFLSEAAVEQALLDQLHALKYSIERAHRPGHTHADENTEQHRETAERGRGSFVDAALVGKHDSAHAEREPSHDEQRREGRAGHDREDHAIGADTRHGFGSLSGSAVGRELGAEHGDVVANCGESTIVCAVAQCP